MAHENYINHVALVLDASWSMTPHTTTVPRVADSQVKHLADQSQVMDQETRVTVYTFDDHVECRIFDKDVLRLPSMKGLYSPANNTALIDATMLSIEDLAMQPQKYGDHSFLIFVLTDGEENRSRKHTRSDLSRKLDSLPDNWTIAALVPNAKGEAYAKEVGFFAGNIAQWDTSSTKGLEDSFARIRQATDSFMTGRTQGIRGTRSLFSMDPTALNKATVRAANLTPVANQFVNVDRISEIRDFVERITGYPYQNGAWFYQLSKPEKVQAQKKIAVMEKSTGRVYTGPQARQLVGLPDHEVRVRPDFNPDYDLFVQSTSVNRKLVPGTKLLKLV